jgi:phenylalanyl-tRNA synthetase beta chain
LPQRDAVILRASTIEQMLGIVVPDTEIQRMFSALGFSVEPGSTAGEWLCSAPSWRFDMGREADLIEEVARLFGFDNIPARPLSAAGVAVVNPECQTPLTLLKHRLVARGFNEAITFSFVSPELQRLIDPELDPVALRNPISSDLAVMRTSLIPGLLGAAAHNIKRQRPRLRLFETGLRFFPDEIFTQRPSLALVMCGSRAPESWCAKSDTVDFYDIKGEVESLLASVTGTLTFRSTVRPGLHDGQTAEVLLEDVVIGVVARIHPSAASDLDLPKHTYVAELDLDAITQRSVPQYEDISRYPETRRDIAVVVDQTVPAIEVLALARSAAGPSVSDALIFDVYEGEGVAENEKSLAIGLTFRDQSRTLTDEEISESLTQVIVSLQEKLGAKLRH